jgi:hypothetical protein
MFSKETPRWIRIAGLDLNRCANLPNKFFERGSDHLKQYKGDSYASSSTRRSGVVAMGTMTFDAPDANALTRRMAVVSSEPDAVVVSRPLRARGAVVVRRPFRARGAVIVKRPLGPRGAVIVKRPLRRSAVIMHHE